MTQEQLKEVEQLLKAAEFNKVIEIANQQEDLQTDDVFIPKLALAYFFSEDYKKATELFERICQNSKDSVDWFNLSLSLIHNNEPHKVQTALNTALKYNRETDTNGKGIPSPFMRLLAGKAFSSIGDYTSAYNQLNELAEFYRETSKTDDTTLYERGIPLFSEFISLAKDVLPKQKVTDTKQWISYISPALDDNGKKELSRLI